MDKPEGSLSMNRIPRKGRHLLSRVIMTIATFILIIILGFVDYLTGYEFDFSLFYLVPVLMIAWFIGRWQGLVVSAFSAIVWLVADSASGHSYSGIGFSFWNFVTRLVFFSLASLLLSALRNSLEKEDDLSRSDALTGITNGIGFSEQAADEINRARRFRSPLTIAYMAISNLKSVNESMGHSTGNAVLRRVAQTISRNMRSVDTVSRIGGDEFAILLPQTGPEQARSAIAKLHKNCMNAIEQEKWPVTFSIGVVTFFSAPTTIDEMIRMADGLMYTAKEEGANVIKYRVSD
ncbi:MAG: diguanylate cyclase [Chitinivibrionales bacterium]|nr:diguanylate cyclase [Chitinivibrionales bacterium]